MKRWVRDVAFNPGSAPSGRRRSTIRAGYQHFGRGQLARDGAADSAGGSCDEYA
jgi:hypothetical protein